MTQPSSESKRRRLGNPFAAKEEPVGRNGTPLQSNHSADSGYGGSAISSSTSKEPEIKPIENHGQLPGVSADRNLALNQTTGEVVDEDTGQVVTTVTTTTTTSTTTTTRRAKSPMPQSRQTAASSQENAKTSTVHQTTLSVPGSGNDIGNGKRTQEPNQRPGLTNANERPRSGIQNLKDAAIGLQDVGSTLRGTIPHGSSDHRYNTRQRSTANLKNQITTAPTLEPSSTLSKPPKSPRAQPPPLPDSTYDNSSRPPPKSPRAQPLPPSDPAYDNSVLWEHEGLRKRKSMSTMPSSFSPESTGQLGTQKSEGKFKRMLKGRNAGQA